MDSAITGDRVKVDYTLEVDKKVYDTSISQVAKDNKLFDSSRIYEPLIFKVGAGEVIYGLSKGIKGMKIGDCKELVIPPVEGYGFYNENYIKKIPRSILEKQGIEIYPGVKLIIKTLKGKMTGVVTQLDNDQAVIDLNHDLCGKTLKFAIHLLDIIK
ncbi:MAG: FKBP-type peptidyl-prolyl cis-trans isomerase [Nanoarchaeota archaeon]|nr:FKBP-type peptidyl-prolyl cis-trans isomerase [Nanoarchaeota archaeon]